MIASFTAFDAGAQSLAPASSKEKAEPKSREEREKQVPRAYMPPSGMCRIWVDNVPAARQPAPTDCTTAIRNRPPNARVVFGPDKPNDRKAIPPRRPDTTKRKPPA
jgi:hypothetical protein